MDSRKITIEIMSSDNNEGNGGTSKGATKDASDDLRKTINKVMHPLKTISDEVFGNGKGMAYYLVSQALSVSKQYLTYSLQRRFNLKEDYIAENTYNMITSNINRSKSILGSIGAGAAIGATSGPIGAVVGATIGLASNYASYTIQRAQTMSGYYQQLNATNAQVGFQATRAGLVDNGRGTEN